MIGSTPSTPTRQDKDFKTIEEDCDRNNWLDEKEMLRVRADRHSSDLDADPRKITRVRACGVASARLETAIVRP